VIPVDKQGAHQVLVMAQAVHQVMLVSRYVDVEDDAYLKLWVGSECGWGWVVKEEDRVHVRRVAHGVNVLQTMSGLVGENSLVLCLQFPHDLIGGRLSVDLVVFHAGKEGALSV
jgi:hypothetical protein